MIKSIGKDHYNDEFVQYMPNMSSNDYLIIDSEGIVFLKSHGDILINKYLSHPNKFDFVCQDEKYSRPYFFEWNSERYNELFDLNKLYLRFEMNGEGYRFGRFYFVKDGSDVFCVDETLPLKYGEENTNEEIIDKDKLEDFFNSDNYDSMYFIDRESYIKYASNNVDGKVIDMNLVPSDDDIVNLELRNRQMNEVLRFLFSSRKRKDDLIPKKIDDIKNISIYSSGMFHGYYYLMVTSKDGLFDVNWVQLDYLDKDKFKLILGNVPVIEPSIEYVSECLDNYDVTMAYSPLSDMEFEEALNSYNQKKLRKIR